MSIGIEALARARGLWREGQQYSSAIEWTISREPAGLTIERWTWSELAGENVCFGVWLVNDAAAALWILLGDVEPESKACPSCKARGFSQRSTAHHSTAGRAKFADHLRSLGMDVTFSGSHGHYEVRGVCASCSVDGEPTGVVSSPWRHVLLRALDDRNDVDVLRSDDARQSLSVLADWLISTSDRTCPACKRRSLPERPLAKWEWGSVASARQARSLSVEKWRFGLPWEQTDAARHRQQRGHVLGPRELWPMSRPCPRCAATGIDPAGPHALGEALALWLADAVPCRACSQMTEDGADIRGDGGCGWCGGKPVRVGQGGHPDCPRCEGAGTCTNCDGSGIEVTAKLRAIVGVLC